KRTGRQQQEEQQARQPAGPAADRREGRTRLLNAQLVCGTHAGPPSISVVSPWAILISVPWLTVHAVLCVTASTSPAAEGCPSPLLSTPPTGRCTSAPMHGRFTYPMPYSHSSRKYRILR